MTSASILIYILIAFSGVVLGGTFTIKNASAGALKLSSSIGLLVLSIVALFLLIYGNFFA